MFPPNRLNSQSEMQAAVFPTEIGWFCFGYAPGIGEVEVHEISFGHPTAVAAMQAMRHTLPVPTEPTPFARDLIARLRAFVQRAGDDFRDVTLHLTGYTDFQRAVVDCCRAIPVGETRTYGELARCAGRPGAARAVGQVMACNRFPIVVPCHRVVASNGGLGGFSARDGLNLKRRLLRLEGVTFDA
ncbi:MAG: methylated-DNA--[protein]-cysteine S-methyltransferase [Pirellulaceae bacterium]